jgi:hypothetical protein
MSALRLQLGAGFGALGVCERFGFAEGRIFLQFTCFEDRTTIETFDILSIVVFGNQARVLVFAGGLARFGHFEDCTTGLQNDFRRLQNEMLTKAANATIG